MPWVASVLITVKGPRGEPLATASMGVRKDRGISAGDTAMHSASAERVRLGIGNGMGAAALMELAE